MTPEKNKDWEVTALLRRNKTLVKVWVDEKPSLQQIISETLSDLDALIFQGVKPSLPYQTVSVNRKVAADRGYIAHTEIL